MSRSAPYDTPPGRSLAGLGAVAALHLLLGWAIVNGLGREFVRAVVEPIEVEILDEPPPPPPPPPEALPPPPQLAPPPPSFVPPPEIRIRPPPTPPPQITVAPVPPPPPAPVFIAPPAPVPAPPAPAPAPPAPPPPDLSRPARLDVSRCDPPRYPVAARRAQASGTTRIRFRVDASGSVVASEVLDRSGVSRAHRLLDRAAVEALSACRFTPGRNARGEAVGGYASVEYVWRLED